jgi:hypothetical protein
MKLSANVSQPSALRKFKFTDALRAPLLFDGCFPVSKFQAVVNLIGASPCIPPFAQRL